MKQNILHIGLDVDDTQYHGSALDTDTGEVMSFKYRPHLCAKRNLMQAVFSHMFIVHRSFADGSTGEDNQHTVQTFVNQ